MTDPVTVTLVRQIFFIFYPYFRLYDLFVSVGSAVTLSYVFVGLEVYVMTRDVVN